MVVSNGKPVLPHLDHQFQRCIDSYMFQAGSFFALIFIISSEKINNFQLQPIQTNFNCFDKQKLVSPPYHQSQWTD